MKKRNGWLLTYTLGFALLAGLTAAIYAKFGKSAVWVPDGYEQSYTVFAYISDFVRSLISGTAEFKLIDFELGQGLDTLTTLSYYGVCDPLNLLAGLASGNSLEYAYAAAIMIRLYLSGVFLGLFCVRKGAKTGWATACGALIYAMSSYATLSSVRHPQFVNGLMYLPLMLLSVDWALENRRVWAFSLVTALMLISNFYFAYINTLLVVFYVVARLVGIVRESGAKPGARAGLRALGGYLLGAGLSAIFFLPVVWAYLNNSRLGSDIMTTESLWHYSAAYYIGMFAYLGLPRVSPGAWTVINAIPPALLCAFALAFVKNPEKPVKRVRAALIVMLLALLIPYAGKLFNGLGYVTNRWSYAVSMAGGFCAAFMLPKLAGIKGRRLAAMTAAATAYLAACALILVFYEDKLRWLPLLLPMAAYLIMTVALNLIKTPAERLRGALHTMAVLVTTGIYIFYSFVIINDGYISQFSDTGLYSRIMAEPGAAMAEVDDPDFYRVTQRKSSDTHATMLGYNGVGYYWSIVPAESLEHPESLDLAQHTAAARFMGFGTSADLNALAAVKYYLMLPDTADAAPYGYEYLKTATLADGTRCDIYENKYALPLGYVFDEYMTREQYSALSAAGKRAALTGAALVEAPISEVKQADIKDAAVELEYTLSLKNAEISGGRITMHEGAEINLEFDAPENCEIYVDISGWRLADDCETTILVWHAEYDGAVTEFYCSSVYDAFGFDQTGAAICVGLGGGGTRTCTLTPYDGCENSDALFESIKVYALPTDEYASRATELGARGLRNVEVSANRVSGNVALEAPGILQFAIPYSDGWSALVDGEEAELFLSGGMYTGVLLAPGEHEIVLKYRTPMLTAGICVSAASLALGICLIIIKKRGAKRR